MGTLAELERRIAGELNRRDLTAEIAEQVARAIEFHANRRFWFNEDTRDVTAPAGQASVDAPAGLRIADAVFVEVGGYRHALRARSPAVLAAWSSGGVSGQPTDYAIAGGRIELYPRPNTDYPLSVVGVYDLPALATGGANAWTGAAADLIANRVMAVLFAIKLRDPEGAAAAKTAELEALKRLRGESARRLSLGRVACA
jgi:hypothetical protein